MDNKPNPKVSIIVPVYKVEEYLPQCIDSLINQTYENIEIILVNDGSPDNSGKICDEYAAKDERICVIHKINQGVGAARNDGIKKANGKYIYFADADDFCDKELIASCVNVAERIHCELVIFGFKKTDHTGVFKGQTVAKKLEINHFQSNREKLALILSSGTGLAVWDKLIKTTLIKDNNILFDNKKRGEDFTFVFKCFEKAASVCSIEDTFYNYRVLFGSKDKYDQRLIENHLENYSRVREFFFASQNNNDVKQYLSNLFALWFFVVIPLNLANTKILARKEKVALASKLTKSREFLHWLSEIRVRELSAKNKIVFLAGKTKNPGVLISLGWLLSFLRKTIGLKN